MERKVCNVLLIAFLCFFIRTAFAQTPASIIDTINRKIELYGIKHSSSVLFSHFDKNIYIPNEDVWFTTYLLNYNKLTNDPSILTAILIKNSDKKIVLERHFVMHGGLSFGHLNIPGNIAPGDYCFIVYTNILKENVPLDYFTQPVTIKAASRPGFNFTVKDTINNINNGNRLLVHVTRRDASPVPHALVTITVDTMLFKGETDHSGNYTTAVPGYHLNKSPVHTEVSYGNETLSETTLLHGKKSGYSVRFFPEGGSLVYAMPSTIGWEVKDNEGRPEKVRAVLIRDDHPVDTLTTDSYGLGRFKLKPILGSKYEVKLIGDETDGSYKLPNILLSGPVVCVNKAVCNDSLSLQIISPITRNLLVFIHDYTRSYFSFPIKAGPAGKDILVNLETVPKGPCAVTITDSIGRPLAERIFFSHFDRRAACEIETDKPVYRRRQKVTLKLNFTSRDSDAAEGAVSIACVERDRLDPAKTNDIYTYTYLAHEINSLPLENDGLRNTGDSQVLLENILLVRGWRRFTWQDMMKTAGQDIPLRPDSIFAFHGKVISGTKPLKKPVNILLSLDSVTRIIRTDKNGLFILAGPQVTVQEGKNIKLRLSSGSGDNVTVNNPFARTDGYLVDQLWPQQRTGNGGVLPGESLVLDDFKHVLNLNEVVVRAKSVMRGVAAEGAHGANACGDYICTENVLNCPIHASEAEKMPAIKGGLYGIMTSHHGDEVAPPLINGNYIRIGSFRNYENDGYDVVRYLGCKPPEKSVDAVAFEGVLYAKEFYPVNYPDPENASLDYRSTIFWDKICLVNTKHETNLSFFTSDVTGKFRIVIQGLLGHDRFYQQKEITVIP